MNIIIVGIGKLGEYLAKSLVEEGHAVTLIDTDFTTSQNIINNEDLNYICGNALEVSTLMEAGIDSADILICVMERDEQNIMCALIGKKLGAKHTIARIRKPEYVNSINFVKEELGLSMTINPERLTANYIARILNVPSALDATSFFKGRIEMISLKVKEHNQLIGWSINHIAKQINGRVIICAIERNNEIIIPRGHTKVQLHDKLHLTGTPKDINEFLKLVKLAEKTKKVIICGGSDTAMYLAKILLETGMQVKIIEINEERCRVLSEALPNALIIHGDVSDQNILYEEGLDKCDALVALNSIDEENIVISVFASLLKVPKIITKVNHINLDGIVEYSNLDTIITPHKIATNQIVRYVRAMEQSGGMHCESIYKFSDDKLEMLEFRVKVNFNNLNQKIKNLPLKEGILIVAILRDKNIIFPNGEDEIKIRDTIIIIAKKATIKELNDILE